MKKFIMMFGVAAALSVSGNAFAQSIVVSGPSPSINASLWVQQTLPFAIPCNFSTGVNSAPNGVITNFPASVVAPFTLCTFAGNPIEATSEYTIAAIPGSTTEVEIRNISANALAGECGPATRRGNIVSWVPLVVSLKPDYIWGDPLDCLIYGDLVFVNVDFIP